MFVVDKSKVGFIYTLYILINILKYQLSMGKNATCWNSSHPVDQSRDAVTISSASTHVISGDITKYPEGCDETVS